MDDTQPSPTTLDAVLRTRPHYTVRQRILLHLITWCCYLAIRIIGPTIRFAVSFEEGAPTTPGMKASVFSFWHRCVFPCAWLFRGWGFRVMTSQSFDGEYIARIIEKFGFVAVRGSSSRGGVRALLEMRREVDEGHTVAFTIDGPRGPRYVAKPGPVLLAKATGAPMGAFHIALANAWVLKTWDAMMIPKPFTAALVRVASPMYVAANATDDDMKRAHENLQAALDRTREFAEANVGRAGSAEFPWYDYIEPPEGQDPRKRKPRAT
jgi:lysophospholipid acyltransferase (LPLAT)-like uncharacterized protein